MATNLAPLLHTFNINLAAASLTPEGFGLLTMLVDQAQGTGNDLGSGTPRYVEITTLAAAQALRTASYISAEVLALITPVFDAGMPRSSRGIRLVRVDTAAGTPETYSDAYTIYDGLGLSNVWAILTDSRVPSVMAALAATVESTGKHVYFIQDDDGDWVTTGGVPSAFTGLVEYERLVVVSNDTDTDPSDVAWVANRTAWNVDEVSVGWGCKLYGITGPATDLTQAEAGFAFTNNANIIGAYGATDYFIRKGVNISGTQVKVLLSRDVLRARIDEDVQNLVVSLSGQGLFVPANQDGVDMILGLVTNRLERMSRAGHFDSYATPTASVSGTSMTVSGTANAAKETISYTFNFDLT